MISLNNLENISLFEKELEKHGSNDRLVKVAKNILKNLTPFDINDQVENEVSDKIKRRNNLMYLRNLCLKISQEMEM